MKAEQVISWCSDNSDVPNSFDSARPGVSNSTILMLPVEHLQRKGTCAVTASPFIG